MIDDPNDIGFCERCGRWQRRRHAYVEEFGPGDREAWCITGNCTETWGAGVTLVLAARHDPNATTCRCGRCRDTAAATPTNTEVERAATQRLIGPIDESEPSSGAAGRSSLQRRARTAPPH